jgi:hypothetical protein
VTALNRRTVVLLLVFDLFVMAGAFFMLYDRSRVLRADGFASVAPASTGAARPDSEPTAATPERPPAAAGTASEETSPAPSAIRRIRFTYRNSKPKEVAIVGSFNNWQPLAMDRGENHLWTATVALAPGEYSYSYLVDGKAIPDPNSRRRDELGRSVVVVEPPQ